MKAILIALLALTVGVGGVFAAGPLGDGASTDRTIPLSTVDLMSSTTETVGDIPGPCDEPEHASDRRCAGVTAAAGSTTSTTTNATSTTNATTTTETREPDEDVRGPCDEAEHANDPRCTGAAGDGDDDDRRGSNSGPGGGEGSGSGSSGHGGSDDDRSGSNEGSG